MKKISFLIVISAFFLASCGSKNNENKKESSSTSAKTTQKITYSTSSKNTETSQTHSSTVQSSANSSITDNEEAQTEVPNAENSTSSTSTDSAAVQTEAANSENSIAAPAAEAPANSDPLSGYTNEQIEYARVWLTIMGSQYKTDLAKGNFELHVSHAPAGKAINPYDANSLTFPNETVTLSGLYSYQGLVVYSSNHNGSITRYSVPSHFQQNPENQDLLRQEEQNVLNTATIVNIPTGNPEDIKEIIHMMIIDN